MANFLEYIISLRDRMSAQLNAVSASSSRARSGIQTLENQVDSLDGTLRSVSNGGFTVFKGALGNMLGNLMSRIALLGPAIGNAIYDGTVQREKDIVGLTTFVGEHAKEVYANIQRDAQVSPFGTQALLDVNRALISSGLNATQARKDAMNLANAISAVGKGNAELANMAANMQQIKTVGKASSMDIKQFAFAGINVYKMLSEATGKSIQDVQEMTVSYDLLSYALEKAAGKGGIYEGALEKQGKLLGAMMEQTKDTISKVMTDFGDLLRPLFEKGLAYMQSFADKLPTIFESVQPVVKATGEILFWFIDAGISVGKSFVWVYDQIKKGNPWLILLGSIVAGVVTSMILMQSWTMAVSLATSLWTGAQWLLNTALTANPIGLIIAAIAALVAAIGYVIYRVDGWGKMWDYTVKGMQMVWQGVLGSFKVAWLVAEDFILRGFENLKKAWYTLKGLWDEGGAQAGLDAVVQQQQARANAIGAESKQVDDLIKGSMANFKSGAQSLTWSSDGKSFQDFKDKAKAAFGISDSRLPGGTKVPTSFGGDGSSKGKGKGSGKGSESVATGGQRNVTVNITYGNAVGTFNLSTIAPEDGAKGLSDLIIDTITRGVAQGASLGAY